MFKNTQGLEPLALHSHTRAHAGTRRNILRSLSDEVTQSTQLATLPFIFHSFVHVMHISVPPMHW